MAPAFRQNRAQEIADALMVRAQRSAPGAYLGGLAELAREYDVSLTTIREVVRILQSQGCVTVRRGNRGGIFAREPGTVPVVNGMRIVRQADAADDRDLLEFREGLEALAAEMAAAKRTPADVAALRDSVTRYQSLVHDFERVGDRELAEENLRFHRLVAQAAHNPYLTRVFSGVQDLVEEITRRPRYTTAVLMDVARAHERIVDAIANGQPEAAKRRMKAHLRAFSEYSARQGAGSATRPVGVGPSLR
ncbi:MAG: FCD domain-containing protein [Actinomycetia bacterium]|nr:FCD domain-containing protein [Actinomycetes bacterium]